MMLKITVIENRFFFKQGGHSTFIFPDFSLTSEEFPDFLIWYFGRNLDHQIESTNEKTFAFGQPA